MVLVPFAVQVGATLVIVGTAGVANIITLLNDAEAADVHIPKPDVTV